jgi:uncharacterized protein (UPF0261 family)
MAFNLLRRATIWNPDWVGPPWNAARVEIGVLLEAATITDVENRSSGPVTLAGSGYCLGASCDPIFDIRFPIANKVPNFYRSRSFFEHSPFPNCVRFNSQKIRELAFVHESSLALVRGCKEMVWHWRSLL